MLEIWDFPGGPGVKNPPSKAGDADSIPGQRTRISYAIRQISPNTASRKPARHNRLSAIKMF